ncbi:MAG: helix-turn-helix transcriptional regulator [Gemmatimonadota bacterium]
MGDLRLTPAFLHLLLCLSEGPMHGYAAMQEVVERTGGRVRLGPSSLYYALGRLEDAGLIEEVSVEGGADPHEERRRYYALTAAGRKRVREEARMLAGVVAHARAQGYLR